jgi:hypothetical protein
VEDAHKSRDQGTGIRDQATAAAAANTGVPPLREER